MANPAPKIIYYYYSYLIVSVRGPSHTCASFSFVFLCLCLSDVKIIEKDLCPCGSHTHAKTSCFSTRLISHIHLVLSSRPERALPVPTVKSYGHPCWSNLTIQLTSVSSVTRCRDEMPIVAACHISCSVVGIVEKIAFFVLPRPSHAISVSIGT